ncbi:MAG: hypothetical protein HWE39_13150 [Oceanospirillaceae bacterium]|nr:hypothetical protein [Oceanospirillaceae bacterium]
MTEAIQCRAVSVCLLLILLILPIDLIANEAAGLDRTPDRFKAVLTDLRATIQAVNRITALEEAYWRDEGYRIPEDVVRKRDLRGFDLQLEILRVRLNMP